MPPFGGLGIRLSATCARASSNLPQPPRELRPVSLLIGEAARLFGPISVNCEAVFSYDKAHGFMSKISFPIPLIVQEEKVGLTHIESAQFSRRDNDTVQYNVRVVNSGLDNSFSHSVDFSSTVELNPETVRKLLGKARSISNQLLVT